MVFSVRHMYRKLMHSLPTDFPCRSIWNPIVPQIWVFLLGKLYGARCLLLTRAGNRAGRADNRAGRAKIGRVFQAKILTA